MATATQLSGLVIPKVFTPYVQLQTSIKSALIQSGAVSRDGFLDNFLAGGGDVATLPFYKDLTRVASNRSGDDDAVSSTAKAITAASIAVHRLSRNQSWTATDLSADMTGSDPLMNIGDRVAKYWVWDIQNIVLSALDGVFRSNAANNNKDMSVDAYTANAPISRDVIIDGLATMGDSMDELGVLLLHPLVYAKLLKEDNNLTTEYDSDTKRTITRYMGMEVVRIPQLPAGYDEVLGTGVPGKYVSYILGRGSLRLGMGLPKTPTEVWRDPAKANGGGVETLFSRTELAVAPEGHSFVASYKVGGADPGVAAAGDLGLAASWSRTYPERNQVRLARLITKEV
jgi:hypothetical protein